MAGFSIFFDESGKNNAHPHLMGALSIPDNIYSLSSFQELTAALEDKAIHWKEYKGDSKERKIITKLVKTLLDHLELLRMNVIYYDQTLIEKHSRKFNDVVTDLHTSTIYMKLPERLVYGLIRNYGSFSEVDVTITIEESTEYKKDNVQLKEQLKKQLNIQSVYRGESFKIVHSQYASKGQEIGLEATDVLLGIVRTIVSNPDPESRKKRAQITLILTLLQDQRFFRFLEQIKSYEWSSTHHLTEVDFRNYLQIFISKNYEEYASLASSPSKKE